MKFPSAAKISVAIGLMALMTSCDDPKKPQGKVQQSLTTDELAREAEFGPWMSKAGLMFAQEQLPIGDYFAEIEGRTNKGENQYRAIQRTLDTGKYLNAEAMWGLEAESLCQHEIARLRTGMGRSFSQVFTDSTGKAIHQLVMVLPVGAQITEAGRPDLAPFASDVVPQTLEPRPEGETPPIPPPGLSTTESDAGEIQDSSEASTDAITVSPEVTPLEGVGGDSENTAEIAEPDMTDVPDPIPSASPKAGVTSEEVGAVIGELETPEPEPTPEPEATGEPDEPETPARAVEVEDDETPAETSGEEPEPEPDSPAADEPEPAPLPKFITYKVVRGDTLSGLSRRYGVSMAAIKKASGFRSDMLRIGQTLKIPTK